MCGAASFVAAVAPVLTIELRKFVFMLRPQYEGINGEAGVVISIFLHFRQPRGGIRFLESIGFREVNGFLELDQADAASIQQVLRLLTFALTELHRWMNDRRWISCSRSCS